jgi:hypothetical protein
MKNDDGSKPGLKKEFGNRARRVGPMPLGATMADKVDVEMLRMNLQEIMARKGPRPS